MAPPVAPNATPRREPPPPPPRRTEARPGSTPRPETPAADPRREFDQAMTEARTSPRPDSAAAVVAPAPRQDAPPAAANQNRPEPPAAAGAPRPGEGVSPERQGQISAWVDGRSDASGGFLGIGETSTTDKVKEALRGESDLGTLQPNEQRYVLDRMLDRWSAGRGDGPSGANRLSHSLGDAPELRGVVAERMAARSAAIADSLPPTGQLSDALAERQRMAQSYALGAVTAVSGPPSARPTDLTALRNLATSLSPHQAAGFARALGGDPASPMHSLSSGPMLGRTLAAVNGAPPTPTASAFVQNAFAAATAHDHNASPELRSAMAGALAREWHPDDPGRREAEAGRLNGILGTEQGQRLLGAGEPGKVPLEARVNALAAIRENGGITAETLRQTDDPWTNQAIVGPQAQATAQRYLATRGDAPQLLQGSDLDNTVGFAMGVPPQMPAGRSEADAQAAVARGELSLYGEGPQAGAVRAVADQIRQVAGGPGAQVTVLPVTYSGGDTGPVQLPLFRVTGQDGQERYVDNTGRRYDSFEDWRTENKLPPGSMTYPEGGHLRAGSDGQVALGHSNTPETVDTFGEHFSGFVDKAALVGGIVAGGVLIVGSGGTLAPAVIGVAGAVAAGSGAWSVYRGGSELADRADHGQSIDPIQDETARGLWLNVGAGALSVGAFGSAARLAQLGRAGRAIAPLEASAHGYVQVGATVADTAAIANESVSLARNWDRMSGAERAQSLLSMGFWGVGAAAGVRSGGVRQPGDMFNPVAIRDNLLRAYAPPVRPDAALPENAVRIDYDSRTGAVQGIRHGPEATRADIDLHVETAQGIQRSLTLEGQLNTLFRQSGEPPAGTAGWAARIDAGKVRERMQARAQELSDPNLTPARRDEIAGENATDRQHLDELAQDADSFVRDPSRATIDARASSADKARFASGARDAVAVGETTRTSGRNEVTWTVNANHETVRAEAILRQVFSGDEHVRGRSEQKIQSAVGHEGGRGQGADRDDGTTFDAPHRDDGGHIIGHQFLKDQGVINLFPQNSELNQQVYTRFEGEMRGWIEAGGEVRVTVEVGGRDGWGGERPDTLVVRYDVVRPGTDTPVYSNSARFRNETGQSFRGFEQAAEANARAQGRDPATVDVDAEMRRLLTR